MNILLANTTCKVGGVSTFMLSQQAALTALGHRCELFFFEHGTMESHLPSGVPVHFGTLADCMRLAAGGFEVVHANNTDWGTGISAVRQIGARLIVTAHKVREGAPEKCYGWTTANCDALTAVSDGVSQGLEPFTDLPIQVVRSGVDVAMFSPAERPRTSPPIVAWVGRSASLVKRLDILAGIAPVLTRAGFRVWIVDQHGADKAAELTPDAVATLRPIVERWSAAQYADMPELYRTVAASGGCVLSTSEREGLGLSLLEAQASGCLAVGFDVPGVRESVSADHGGVLYALDDAAADVADQIVDLLRDRSRVDALRARATQHVREHFSREAMAQRYLRVYREAPFRRGVRRLVSLQRRLRLAPLVHWERYLEQRCGVGEKQYEASREFSRLGEARLSAAAAREARRTSPTIFLRPARLAHLLTATAFRP
jgi:glycosyltransferase involved in cell wall biosynthesis